MYSLPLRLSLTPQALSLSLSHTHTHTHSTHKRDATARVTQRRPLKRPLHGRILLDDSSGGQDSQEFSACSLQPLVPGPAAVVARPALTSKCVATKPECVRRSSSTPGATSR